MVKPSSNSETPDVNHPSIPLRSTIPTDLPVCGPPLCRPGKWQRDSETAGSGIRQQKGSMFEFYTILCMRAYMYKTIVYTVHVQ